MKAPIRRSAIPGKAGARGEDPPVAKDAPDGAPEKSEAQNCALPKRPGGLEFKGCRAPSATLRTSSDRGATYRQEQTRKADPSRKERWKRRYGLRRSPGKGDARGEDPPVAKGAPDDMG